MDILNTFFAGEASLQIVLMSMLLAFVLGHVIAWTYMSAHIGLSYSRVFVVALVVIPVIVSVVMTLMINNLIMAFGLMAVFAVVRFRNVLKDTGDTAFILWAMVIGMAVGTQQHAVAIAACLMISAMFMYLRFTRFGTRHRYDVVLSLNYKGVGTPSDLLRPLLNRHAVRIQLAGQRGDGEEGQDLSFRLLMRDPSRSQELIKELQQIEGVRHTSLYLSEDESEM